MNDYPNSANIPNNNTWSRAAPPQTNTSSFNNYAINSASKWSTHTSNQSGNHTPTNPTLTTFPSFGGNIPPLYPSISAQSSNSINQGGAPSPFGPQNTNNSSQPTHATSHQTHTHAGHKTIHKSISASSSNSSLSALTGGMTKLHINTNYNPYANIPDSNGTTPTGFRFNTSYSNPYQSIATPNIATPTTPLNATPINKWSTANALQQTAAMNNLNAMNMNYQFIGGKYVSTNAHNQNPNKSANASFNSLPTLSNPSSGQNQQIKSVESNNGQSKLNSNAMPYRPPAQTVNQSQLTQNVVNAALKANDINEVMKSQQLQHQQKADRVPYSYPSYAEAVNKVTAIGKPSLREAVLPTVPPQANVAVPETETETPPTAAAMSNESQEAIQKLNPVSWPCNPRHSKFYVIKSFGEDDVHKSIKYNLWCSTERGNRKLDEAFNESKRINAAAQNNMNGPNGMKKGTEEAIDPRDTTRGCPVYLFFSVNRSGCFCGMAQMISNYYKDRHFGSWVQDGKWQGSFIVKWIYVKDIPNKDLKDITLPNNDNRPVTFSRDTQEIPFNQGVEMLRRFVNYEPKTNILQDFKYYDDRERDIKHKRTQQIILQRLQPQSGDMNAVMNNQRIDINNMSMSSAPQNMNNINANVNANSNPTIGFQSHSNSYRNNNAPNNKPPMDGYNSYPRGNNNNYGNKRHNNNNNYGNKNRKYYGKNDKNYSQQRGYKNYGNNRYNSNNAQSNNSNYGSYQILSKNRSNPTPDNNGMNNAQTNQNESIDNTGNNEPKGRYNNRNRNRWVPK